MAACLEKSAGKLLTFIMTSKLKRERSLSFSLVGNYVFLRSGHIVLTLVFFKLGARSQIELSDPCFMPQSIYQEMEMKFHVDFVQLGT